jgi:thiamine biosynthesis protein ThiS
MTVTVNGKPMELPAGLTIDGLLAHLKVRREFTAVALNREVALRSRYAETQLHDGDKIEIVHPMGGG